MRDVIPYITAGFSNVLYSGSLTAKGFNAGAGVHMRTGHGGAVLEIRAYALQNLPRFYELRLGFVFP